MISYTFLKTNYVYFLFLSLVQIITRTLLAALTKKIKFRKLVFELIKLFKLHILFALHLLMIKKKLDNKKIVIV